MHRQKTKDRILKISAVVVLVVTIVLLIVLLSGDKPRATSAEATVVRASLSSNISSTGVVKNFQNTASLPLAVLTEGLESLEDFAENNYEVNLITLLQSSSLSGRPLVYQVVSVNEEYSTVTKKLELSTADESEELMTLSPVYFDWEAAEDYYRESYTMMQTQNPGTDVSLRDYIVASLVLEGLADMDLSQFPSEFFKPDMSQTVTLTTGYLSELLLETVGIELELFYTVSDFVWEAGDLLVLDNTMLTLSYNEWMTVFTLSEYDVAPIDARMKEGDPVYAAVGINALSGKKLIAELIDIGSGSNSSGVTYYSVTARLIFPEITEDEDGAEKGSYVYYDEVLSDATVSYLGVKTDSNLTKDDLIANYSVTVTAQKTVVEDTLVIPTKCIYYDDAKNPYVNVLDSEKKEKRVYIEITLSTGTEAAVTAKEGYRLNEGDVLRYTADASLLNSLF